jgi:putative transposase
MPGPKPPEILLTDAERQGLEKRIHRYSTPQQVALRARLILLAAEGKHHVELTKQMNVSLEMARLWRLKVKPSQSNAWLI